MVLAVCLFAHTQALLGRNIMAGIIAAFAALGAVVGIAAYVFSTGSVCATPTLALYIAGGALAGAVASVLPGD